MIEFGQYLRVNVISFERIGVLAKAKGFEPLPHITHWSDISVKRVVRRVAENHRVAE